MSKKTFEQSMKQLEHIVEELEFGDLPLEKALKKFEEGVRLSKICNKKLDEVEQKITVLTKDENDNIQEESFTPNAISDEETD